MDSGIWEADLLLITLPCREPGQGGDSTRHEHRYYVDAPLAALRATPPPLPRLSSGPVCTAAAAVHSFRGGGVLRL